MLLLIQILISSSFCDITTYKDKHVDPLLATARAVREHPLQRQTRSIIEQIYNNLDRAEYESMRKKLMEMTNKLDEKKYYEIENKVRYEAVFLFKEAIEKIPGTKITSDYYPIKEAQRKDWLGRLIPNPEPLKLSSRKDVTDFRVHGSSINFELDGKVYSMNPGILSSTRIHLVSTNASKYNLAQEKCFRPTDEQRKKYSHDELCEDSGDARSTEYRVGKKFIKLNNDDLDFTIAPNYNSYKNTGEVSLTSDVITNSIFSAVRFESGILEKKYWSMHTEYAFSKEQRVKIDAIDSENGLYIKNEPQQSSGGSR